MKDSPFEEPEVARTDRLRALDQDAWAELYDRHHMQIWRYAYGRTNNRHAADDVAAQVFVEALASIQRYRYKGLPILAWLYGIARNLVWIMCCSQQQDGLVHLSSSISPPQ